MIRSSRLTLTVVAASLVLGACHKKKPVVAATPVPTASAPVPVAPRTPTTTATPAADDGDTMRRAVAEARARLLETIYFEYDKDELRDDAKATLDAKLPLLNLNSGLKVRIAGHCDERGSDEYNIALGRRRAETAKKYLVDRGVDPSRIETVSFGRERPAVSGESEDAWAKNRRDEFVITAGGDQLRAK